MKFAQFSRLGEVVRAAISLLIFAALISSCASAPKLPQTIDEVCPLDDDEACPAATDSDVRGFFKRYGV